MRHINLSIKNLKSLPKDLPESVIRDFYCYGNKLTSLEGAPRIVGWVFDCSFNKLTSLKNASSNVGGDFLCGYNKLTSLKGAPRIVRRFSCWNNRLISFDFLPIKREEIIH